MEQQKNTVIIMLSKMLIDSCYDIEWVPYCKKIFSTVHNLLIDYLGKYTHRIAISNHRIIHMDNENVTFSVKDYRKEGQWKELTLSGIEFIRRFSDACATQTFLSGSGIMDFFVPAANTKSSLYAGISSDAKNIFQSSGIRRCQKY